MLGSLHNFLFMSFDAGSLPCSIDNPRSARRVQIASAKLVAIPLSLLLPEAIIATFTVAVQHWVLARRLGPVAGRRGADAGDVPVVRGGIARNDVDPLLILLMLLACAMALIAVERDGGASASPRDGCAGRACVRHEGARGLPRAPGDRVEYLVVCSRTAVATSGDAVSSDRIAVVGLALLNGVVRTDAGVDSRMSATLHRLRAWADLRLQRLGPRGRRARHPRPRANAPARSCASAIAAAPVVWAGPA